MLETTTEPLTLDVYRGNSMLPDPDRTAWNIDFDAGRDSAYSLCGQGEIPQLLHGRAKIEDIRDINVIEGWCSIDPRKVKLVELISLSPETYMQMLDQLTERVTQIETHEEEIRALKDEVDELRREEAENEEDV